MGKINALLDKGYKMTNFSCSFCGAVTFSLPGTDKVNCPKCGKEYQPDIEEQDPVEGQYEEFLQAYKQVTPKQSKSDEISKKMGARLIQGWAMLEESCDSCNVPLMKSKGGDKICCGCDRNHAAKNPPPHNK